MSSSIEYFLNSNVSMERAIIRINRNSNLNIPSINVWMSEMELVELFGVIAPTLRANIRAIQKSETLNHATTQRCDFATPTSSTGFYSIKWSLLLRLG
jgi:hypothetical protein